MITDKLTATHNFLEELAKQAGKAGFMPAGEIGLALQYLEEKGIPNNKHEDYKYCNIEAILRKEFKTITGKEVFVNSESFKQTFSKDTYSIHVVNGKLFSHSAELDGKIELLEIENTPTEILKKHLAQYAKSNSDALIAVNVAYADRGLFIHVTKSVDKPIVMHHVNSSEGNLFFNVRNLFVIEKNAEVELTEFYHSSNQKYFINNLTEIFVGENAHVSHTVVQNAGIASYLVNTTKAYQ
ncbi:MAG TPA: SufD family Fe-S cluster assembly protein, partial [Bacteroidia bacterium]|nr:SufD family Fe-S cluster assembly protein [Bacteroidia bacterium]